VGFFPPYLKNMTDTLATTNPQPDLKKLQQTKVAGTITLNSIDELQRLGQILSQSGFFDDCKQAAQAVVKILAGSELGIPAFASMCGIHLIKGKPAIGANLIAAAIKRSGRYDYRVVELSDRVCKITFFEQRETAIVGSPQGGGFSKTWQQVGISEFSAADAAKAGTQNMGKFPRNMLFARCISNGVKWFCPDIFLGAPVYTPEELGATFDEDGTVIEVPVQVTKTLNEVYRTWKTPTDALLWGATILPDLTPPELQKLFDSVPAVNGKKAPAFVEKVLSMAIEF